MTAKKRGEGKVPIASATLDRPGTHRGIPSQVAEPPAGVLTIDQAAALSGKTGRQLRQLVAERKVWVAEHGSARPSDIPDPIGPLEWSLDEIRAWCLYLGIYQMDIDGAKVALIGYAGIGALLGLRGKTPEQTIRKKLYLRRRHIAEEGRAWWNDIPAPVVQPVARFSGEVMFATDAIRLWALRIGALRPDGTPRPDRPHRGTSRAT